MSNKKKYRLLCEQESSITIFNQAWWLDVVCDKGEWDVCLVEEGETIVASIPFYIKKRYGFTLLTQPLLTQYLGVWLRPINAKYNKILARQKKLMTMLIKQLPSHDYFMQNWHYSQTNWLPFYWKGFSQTTAYTYVIEDLSDLDKIWTDLQGNVRKEIRKAENRFNLTVRTDLPVEDFIDLNKLTFKRQNRSLPYSEMLVKNIADTAMKRKQCKTFIAQDEEGKNHAGLLVIWDENCAYYLMGGGDPDLRSSGATSLCMWEAIKYSATKTNKFDFEGSMVEPIENFFRGFGGVQKPYFSISKTPSKFLETSLLVKSLIK